MTNAEYLATQVALMKMAHMIRGLKVDEFLARIDAAEAVGPFVDPTLYRAAMPRVAYVKALGNACKTFQVKTALIPDEFLAEADEALWAAYKKENQT